MKLPYKNGKVYRARIVNYSTGFSAHHKPYIKVELKIGRTRFFQYFVIAPESLWFLKQLLNSARRVFPRWQYLGPERLLELRKGCEVKAKIVADQYHGLLKFRVYSFYPLKAKV